MVWYAHRLSLLTNSLECCRHGKGRAAAPRPSASEFFSGSRRAKKKPKTSLRAVSKRRRTETRIVSPLFPTDQYKRVSLCGPTNAASRDRTRAQLPDETARGLFFVAGNARARKPNGASILARRTTVFFPATKKKKEKRNRKTRVGQKRGSEKARVFFWVWLSRRPTRNVRFASFAPKSVMERYGTSPHDSDISRRDRPRGASTPRETFGFCFKGTGRANMSVRHPTR